MHSPIGPAGTKFRPGILMRRIQEDVMSESTNNTRSTQTASGNTCTGDLAVLVASRREALKSGATFVAGMLAAEILPSAARAQDAGAAELNKVLAGRRILIKGGVVLTLDRQLGDFARADVLIEDG